MIMAQNSSDNSQDTATTTDGIGPESSDAQAAQLDDVTSSQANEQDASLKEECVRLKDQLLRTAADYDNYRKRTRKEVEDVSRRGKEDVIRELLPVFDNLERAIGAAEGATDIKAVVEGVAMVLKMFEDISGRLGLQRVQTLGQRFDPNLHDALQQEESATAEPGTVIKELVPGYRMGDRLLRAAMVVVAKAPAVQEGPRAQDPGLDASSKN